MSLLTSLQQDLVTSLKAGKTDRVGALRMLIAGAKNAGIAKYGAQWEEKLTDADILDVVKKQVKTHKESIDAFGKADRRDLVAKEEAELAVLAEYAPKELSDDELRSLLEPIAKSGEPPPAGGFGLLMGKAMAAVAGQADGGRVAAMLKEMLQG